MDAAIYDFSRIGPHVFQPSLLTLLPDPAAAFCQWFEDFGRRLAPRHFGNTPLYVVDARMKGPGDTLGFAGECLDLVYQEQIGQRWRGRGACFAVDLQQVQDQADAEAPHDEARKPLFIRRALELALHEFGHVLTHDRPFNPEISQARAQRLVAEVITSPGDNAPGKVIPWLGHDAHFLRTLAHVEHRASMLLVSPIQSYSLGGPLYGLSSGEAYRAAIADEPARLAGEDLAAIKQARPTQAFIDLWQRDLSAWGDRNDPLSDYQALALEQGQTLFS